LETIYEVSRDDCFDLQELGSSSLLFPVLKYSPSYLSAAKQSPAKLSEIKKGTSEINRQVSPAALPTSSIKEVG